MHAFEVENARAAVLLVHGSIEDSRIFHSNSGKGLAPFLAKNGFNVYAPDLQGRGKSEPPVSRHTDQSQTGLIREEIPEYFGFVKQRNPGLPVFTGAHSWGGVLLLSWLAWSGIPAELKGMFFFGTKRRIRVKNWRKLLAVDLMWTAVGELATRIKGYFPAKPLGMGSENEPATLYRQTRNWVYEDEWKDPEDGFDYRRKLQGLSLPPMLHFAGVKDHYLGNPRDVKLLSDEVGSQDRTDIIVLGRHFGNLHDYAHINMLTHRDAPEDHFPILLRWFDNCLEPEN